MMTKVQKDKVAAMQEANKRIWRRAGVLADAVDGATKVQARKFLGTQPGEVKVILDGNLDRRAVKVRDLLYAFSQSLSKDTKKPGPVKRRTGRGVKRRAGRSTAKVQASATNGQIIGTADGSYQILGDLKDLADKHGLVTLDRGLTTLKELQIV